VNSRCRRSGRRYGRSGHVESVNGAAGVRSGAGAWRPALKALERRTLLGTGPVGDEFRANTWVPNAQRIRPSPWTARGTLRSRGRASVRTATNKASSPNVTAPPERRRATIGSFKADFAAPAAKLKKLAKVKRRKWPFKFTVICRDDVALNALSIGPGDILITGPKGFKKHAKFKSKLGLTAGTFTAVYEIAPPGKKWDAADNGSYTIWLNAKHVLDATGKAAKKTKLGVLKVKC